MQDQNGQSTGNGFHKQQNPMMKAIWDLIADGRRLSGQVEYMITLETLQGMDPTAELFQENHYRLWVPAREGDGFEMFTFTIGSRWSVKQRRFNKGVFMAYGPTDELGFIGSIEEARKEISRISGYVQSRIDELKKTLKRQPGQMAVPEMESEA